MNTIGVPDYVGANGEFNTCSATFATPASAKAIVSVSVSMAADRTASLGYQWTIGDTAVRVNAAPEFCTAYLPFDDKQSLRFVVTTKSDLAARASKVDVCPEAAAVAAAAGPHLGEWPLRSNSLRAHMNTKLSRLDPCTALDVLAVGHSPLVNASPDPWACVFDLDWGVRSTARHISFSYDEDAKLTKSPYSHETVARIDGYPSLESPGDRYTPWADACQIYVGTDPQWVPAKYVGSRKTEMISVSAEGGGCDAARTVAAEVMRLYTQLPG